MMPPDSHYSDRDLLLWAEGELSSQSAAGIQRHVSTCARCRTRAAEIEQTIGDFVHLYRAEADVRLPPIEGPRAMLKARMAEFRAASGSEGWFSRARIIQGAGALAALLLVAGVAIRMGSGSSQANLASSAGAVPNPFLTPGATSPINVHDVCSAVVLTNDPEVPDSLKRAVLEEYGLKDASANSYEIDYLVTPELGGVANIRNLWPQPSANAVWNARVKDALEDRLHSMVCSGQLGLTTAQREISKDWVAAYKKYFHTDNPLPEHSWRGAIGIRRRAARSPLAAVRS